MISCTIGYKIGVPALPIYIVKKTAIIVKILSPSLNKIRLFKSNPKKALLFMFVYFCHYAIYRGL